MTAYLAGSPASAADYFHLGVDGTRIGTAANYSNTNGSTTAATVNPGSADDLIFFNSTAGEGPLNRRLELGAANLIFNSLTFSSNAGTTQIDRGAAPGSTAGNILGVNAGGITVAAGSGPVTFGTLTNSGNNQRVIVGVYQDLTVANNSSNDLTFNREFDGRGAAQRTVTVGGSGSGNTIFKEILSHDAARDVAMTINTSGTGVVRFDGTNTYRGATTVTAGTLLINGSTLNLSTVSVASNAVIGGNGTINGSLTLADGALLAFDTATTLTVVGTLTLDSSFGVDSLRSISGTAIDWSSVASSASGYTLLNTSFVFDATKIRNFGLSNAHDIGDGRIAYFKDGSLALVVIPEPSTSGILTSSLAALAILRRPRR